MTIYAKTFGGAMALRAPPGHAYADTA